MFFTPVWIPASKLRFRGTRRIESRFQRNSSSLKPTTVFLVQNLELEQMFPSTSKDLNERFLLPLVQIHCSSFCIADSI